MIIKTKLPTLNHYLINCFEMQIEVAVKLAREIKETFLEIERKTLFKSHFLARIYCCLGSNSLERNKVGTFIFDFKTTVFCSSDCLSVYLSVSSLFIS